MGLLRSTAFLAALPLALAQNGTNSSTSNPFNNPGAVSGQTSPPSYPSPWGEGLGDWDDAYAKAREFVSQLTLLEKVNLTTGVGWEGEKCVGNTGAIPRLGFEALCLQDSPLGVRFADFVSAFPAGVTVAATWDRELFHLRGHDMGVEHREKGIDVQLGPAIGPIGRHPAGGRNWLLVCMRLSRVFKSLVSLLAPSIISEMSKSTTVRVDLMSARPSRRTSTIPLWYVDPAG
jgi:beta-glucosidase